MTTTTRKATVGLVGGSTTQSTIKIVLKWRDIKKLWGVVDDIYRNVGILWHDEVTMRINRCTITFKETEEVDPVVLGS